MQPALALGAFYGSAKDGKISSATREDLAEIAVNVLVSAGHEGKTYELAGDGAYTLSNLAAEISKQAGKEIPYVDIPEANYANALKQAGLPEGLSEGLASWDVGASQCALFSDDKTLSRLLASSNDIVSGSSKSSVIVVIQAV